MKRTLITSGSTFEQQIGYSRAVVQGDWVFVSGTTGFDYATMTIPDSIEPEKLTIEEAIALADRVFVLSARPARLKQVYQIDLPRPRDQISTKQLPRFQELRKRAFDLIEGVGHGAARTAQQ